MTKVLMVGGPAHGEVIKPPPHAVIRYAAPGGDQGLYTRYSEVIYREVDVQRVQPHPCVTWLSGRSVWTVMLKDGYPLNDRSADIVLDMLAAALLPPHRTELVADSAALAKMMELGTRWEVASLVSWSPGARGSW